MTDPHRTQLLRWQQQGNLRELRRARGRMRRRRLGELWVGLGLWLGHVVNPVVMTVLYLTAFAPFGLIGRAQRSQLGWIAPKRAPGGTLQDLRNPG